MPEQNPNPSTPDSAAPGAPHLETEMGDQATPAEEPAPMLDVHPAHHAANTWRDFFIHIATIVIGLLIAVGLEQTVEYIHHRRLVAETREALRVEEEQNRRRFALETKWFIHITPRMQTNIQVLLYLRDHPHAPASTWPGRFYWGVSEVPYVEAAWNTAQQDGAIQHMPPDEVQRHTEIYTRIRTIRELENAERYAGEQSGSLLMRGTDLSQLNPAEIEEMLHDSTQLLLAHHRLGAEQRRLNIRYPQFAPAPEAEQISVRPDTAEEADYAREATKELKEIDDHP
jgi:hypothetical protein